MLRMKTSSSAACACIRSRSPSTAPPLNGLVGSTAITPTDIFLSAWGPTPTPDALGLWPSRVSRTGRRSRASSTPDALGLWPSHVSRTGRRRISDTNRSTSVLLPAPGGPVTPIRYARPVRGKIARTRSALFGSSSSMREIARAMARGSPASTRSASIELTNGLSQQSTQNPLKPQNRFSQRVLRVLRWMSCLGSSRQELARNDQPLDLARPFADGRQLHVAEVFLGRIVLHEAVAAVDLDAVVGHLDRDFARVQLRHRRLERRAPAALFQIRRAIGEQPRRFDLRGGVGELPLNRLKAADGFAERLPLAGVS